MKSRILALLLAACLLVSCFPAAFAADGPVRPTQPDDLKAQISWLYKACLADAYERSFNGYCAMYVNYQLYLLGINRQFVGGNGKDEFDNYRYLSKSNGGYTIAAYPAYRYSLRSALNAISENGKKDVYNVMVGFERSASAAGQKWGHTLFIHAIINGIVYYSDSLATTSDGVKYPEGAPIAASIDSFCDHYNSWTTLDGVVHFYRDYSDHTCTKGTKLFQSCAHPHGYAYQCGICGTIWIDQTSNVYLSDCGPCNMPEKTKVSVSCGKAAMAGESISFTWPKAKNATGYNLLLSTLDSKGKTISTETYMSVNSGTKFTLPAGSYSVSVVSVNNKAKGLDAALYGFAISDPVAFRVLDKWDCSLLGHQNAVCASQEATCIGGGWIDSACSECGKTNRTYFGPLGHSYESSQSTAPTDTADGYTFETCTRCGRTHETYLPALSRNPFKDVAPKYYYYAPVVWAYENAITGGTAPDKFDPNGAATRAQVVTFLWRAMGSPQPQLTEMPFTDVKPDAYYTPAVLWAYENGITYGTTSTTFTPNQPVNRAAFVTFLYRAMGSPEVDAQRVFPDVSETAYYGAPVYWAVEHEITGGVGGGRFAPSANCSRGQVVSFLYRALAQ